MSRLKLTLRDREILTILTNRVRLLSVDQIGRTWWGYTRYPTLNAKRRLKRLEQAELVQTESVTAHPEIPVSQPVFHWKPGDTNPRLGPVSWRLQKRWKQPPTEACVAFATKKAAVLFAGRSGRSPRASEATHDIHLGAVYLHFRMHRPNHAAYWMPETQIRHSGRGRSFTVPDAVIRRPNATPTEFIVEFGGAYSTPKLERFHDEHRHLTYEIW